MHRVERDGVGFVVLPPPYEPSIQWNVSQHVPTRHDDSTAQDAFVGFLLWLLASPVGSGKDRFGALLSEAMDQLVWDRPASAGLYCSNCRSEPLTPNIGVSLDDDLSPAGLDRWVYRSALAPPFGWGSRLDQIPAWMLTAVALTHPIPCPRSMPTVAPVWDNYGDAQ